MQFIRGLHNLLLQREECVATIGNFDGVHLGHHAVLDQVKENAKSTGLLSTVVIFEPQPIEFFAPDKAPSRLTRLREKLQQFALHDIDRVVCLRFDENMANLSANEFVDEILLRFISNANVKVTPHTMKNVEPNKRNYPGTSPPSDFINHIIWLFLQKIQNIRKN